MMMHTPINSPPGSRPINKRNAGVEVIIESDFSGQPRKKRPRVRRACLSCQKRKNKCSGSVPCVLCAERGFECVFEASKMYPTKVDKPGQDPQALTRKMTKLDTQRELAKLTKYLDDDLLPRILLFVPIQKLKMRLLLSTARESVEVSAKAVVDMCENSDKTRNSNGALIQAKRLVSLHVSEPNVCSVAAIMLIAYTEAAEGSYHKAWIWCGVAFRMCQEMEVYNLPVDDFGYQVYWSLAVLECMLAHEVGKSQVECNGTPDGISYHLFRLVHVLDPIVKFLNDPCREPQEQLDEFDSKVSTQLPENLILTTKNIRRFHEAGMLPVFVTLHVWREALCLLVKYPSVAFNGSPLIPRTTHITTPPQHAILTLIEFCRELDSDCFKNPLLARPLLIAATAALNMQSILVNDADINAAHRAYVSYKSTLEMIKNSGWNCVGKLVDELQKLEEEKERVSFTPTDYWDVDIMMNYNNDEEVLDLIPKPPPVPIEEILVNEFTIKTVPDI